MDSQYGPEGPAVKATGIALVSRREAHLGSEGQAERFGLRVPTRWLWGVQPFVAFLSGHTTPRLGPKPGDRRPFMLDGADQVGS
jgi:hypothetical protein